MKRCSIGPLTHERLRETPFASPSTRLSAKHVPHNYSRRNHDRSLRRMHQISRARNRVTTHTQQSIRHLCDATARGRHQGGMPCCDVDGHNFATENARLHGCSGQQERRAARARSYATCMLASRLPEPIDLTSVSSSM